MKVEVKPFKENPNYLISSDGKVYSIKKTGLKELKQYLHPNGYMYLRLCGLTQTVHRIMAKTFLPRYHSKLVVNHKNGIKTDNRLENLEMCTQRYNINHAMVTGQMPYDNHKKVDYKGNKRLSQVDIQIIESKLAVLSVNELSDIFSVSPEIIENIKLGKRVTSISYKPCQEGNENKYLYNIQELDFND